MGSLVLPRELEDIGLENTPEYDPYEDETQNEHIFPQLAKELEPMPEVGDHHIGADMLLPIGDQMTQGHVVAWSHDANRDDMGRACMYKDGLITNIIAESIYAQCDAERNEYLLLDSLIKCLKDDRTISLTDQMTSIWSRLVTHKSNAGWKICCKWKDGSTSWEISSNLKDSHQVQAEFPVTQGVGHESAFNWWVKQVLKKRDRVVASVRK